MCTVPLDDTHFVCVDFLEDDAGVAPPGDTRTHGQSWPLIGLGTGLLLAVQALVCSGKDGLCTGQDLMNCQNSQNL